MTLATHWLTNASVRVRRNIDNIINIAPIISGFTLRAVLRRAGSSNFATCRVRRALVAASSLSRIDGNEFDACARS